MEKHGNGMECWYYLHVRTLMDLYENVLILRKHSNKFPLAAIMSGAMIDLVITKTGCIFYIVCAVDFVQSFNVTTALYK